MGIPAVEDAVPPPPPEADEPDPLFSVRASLTLGKVKVLVWLWALGDTCGDFYWRTKIQF